MEPHRLQPLYPMLSATNSGLALAPVAKPGAAPAQDLTCVQAKDLGASAAGSADELKENDPGAHANADNADIARDRRIVDSLQRHSDMHHVGCQSARSTHVGDAD
jgi:hypothetical protein